MNEKHNNTFLTPQALTEVIPEAVLPPLWGGTNTGKEQQEEFAVIGMGGPVPLYYQTLNKPQEIAGDQDGPNNTNVLESKLSSMLLTADRTEMLPDNVHFDYDKLIRYCLSL